MFQWWLTTSVSYNLLCYKFGDNPHPQTRGGRVEMCSVTGICPGRINNRPGNGPRISTFVGNTLHPHD
jgi:hypothetical protein